MFKLLCEICCRSASRESIEKLSVEEWDRLWQLSLRHKVSPVLDSSIRALKVSVPAATIERIVESRSSNLLKSMRYLSELARLTKIFNKNNIRFLSFKGVALLGLLDEELDQRQCGDMDILLVDPMELIVADKLLEADGYRRVVEVDQAALANPEMLLRFNTKDLRYVHEDKQIEIELHIAIFHIRFLPITNEEYYLNRAEFYIGSTAVPVMGKEDHLLYLLVHGSFSIWHRLKWLIDLPMISNNGQAYMDNAFHERCMKLGVQRSVLQGLGLANQLLQMPLCEKISKDLASKGVKKMNTNRVLKILKSEKSPQDGGRFQFMVYRFYTCCVYWPTMRSELSFKLACIGTMLFTLKDYQLLPLPTYLHWLYIPLRPVIWLSRPLKKRW